MDVLSCFVAYSCDENNLRTNSLIICVTLKMWHCYIVMATQTKHKHRLVHVLLSMVRAPQLTEIMSCNQSHVWSQIYAVSSTTTLKTRQSSLLLILHNFPINACEVYS